MDARAVSSSTRVSFLAVLSLGAALKISLLDVDRYRPKADEGYYRRYAAALAVEPRSSLSGLVDAYLSHEKWQRFPSPLRAGHIVLSAAWMRLQGTSDFQSLSCLSTYFALATLLVCYAFTRRLFGPEIAVATLALMAASPLQLALGRRALQDAVVCFFILSALWAFYEMVATRSRVWSVAFSAAFFMAVLSKESSVLLLAFFVPWLVVERALLGADVGWEREALALVAPLGAALFCWLWICAGPAKFIRLLEIVVLGPGHNPYVALYQTGSVLRYFGDFFLVSPFVLLLATTSFAVRGDLRSGAGRPLYLIGFFAACYLAYSAFPKNLRYVLALDFPLRALAVLAVWRWTAALPRRGAVRAAALLALVLVDLFLFRRLFLEGGIYDPLTSELLESWKELLKAC